MRKNFFAKILEKIRKDEKFQAILRGHLLKISTDSIALMWHLATPDPKESFRVGMTYVFIRESALRLICNPGRPGQRGFFTRRSRSYSATRKTAWVGSSGGASRHSMIPCQDCHVRPLPPRVASPHGCAGTSSGTRSVGSTPFIPEQAMVPGAFVDRLSTPCEAVTNGKATVPEQDRGSRTSSAVSGIVRKFPVFSWLYQEIHVMILSISENFAGSIVNRTAQIHLPWRTFPVLMA